MSVKLEKSDPNRESTVDPLMPVYRATTDEIKPSSQGAHWHVFWAAGAVNLLALAAGCVLCWTSPALPKYKEVNSTIHLNEAEEAWITSLMPLGAVIGPIPSGVLADRFGRKYTLLADGLVLLSSWILIALAAGPGLLMCGRLISGFSIGTLFTVIPIYIGEIATDSVRSTLGTLLQLSLTVGFMVPFGAGPYISPVALAVMSGTLPIVFIAAFYSMPESPYFLLAEGDRDAASRSLEWLRGQTREGVRKELERMAQETADAMANKKPVLQAFLQIFSSRASLKAFYLSCGLLMFQQFSGINAVLFNAESIFSIAKTSLSGAVCSMVIGLVQIGASACTVLLTARFSIKTLLVFSGFGMSIGLVMMGVYFHLSVDPEKVANLGTLPLVALVFYIIVYCFGFGPLPWAAMGEMFTADLKAISSSVCASYCWFLGFLVTLFFNRVAGVIGWAWTFWSFGIASIVAALFTMLLVPNTKGKSLQEIQRLLSS